MGITTKLGKAKCNECGGQKYLIIKKDKNVQIWSECENCGFIELEWIFGDNPKYLETLAENYNVDIEEIKQAIKILKPKIPTDIQTTIYQQLIALGFLPSLFHIILIALDDGRTLRLHVKHRGNIDITYNEGRDCYQIKAYKLKDRIEKFGDETIRIPNIDVEKVYENDDVYCMELMDIILYILNSVM